MQKQTFKQIGTGGSLVRERGFSLMETIVAISILMMTIIGPLSLASKGIVFADYVKDEITAFYLAQEALEVIRNIRDSNIGNNIDWLTNIKDKCMEGGKVCRIDIWKYSDPDKGISFCVGVCDNEGIKTFERLKVVDVGGALSNVKLYGYDFNQNILAGRTSEDSNFYRKITIRPVDYSSVPGITASDLRSPGLSSGASINEVSVSVEVYWMRSSLKGIYAERRVKVSENLFSI